jgi:hypothetical protein
MAGKSKGPRLHTHVHLTAPSIDRSDELIDALLDGDLIEDLHRSGIFTDDGLPFELPILAHPTNPDDLGQPRVVVGSPHGGPVFVLTVGQLTPSSADVWRAHLAEIYDRKGAAEHGETLEEFRAHIRDGWDYCAAGYVAPTSEGRAALGHAPFTCYRPEDYGEEPT